MRLTGAITLGFFAGIAWGQSDDLTPRQIFDYGVKPPAARPAAVPRPKSAERPPVKKTPEKPAAGNPPETAKAPDRITPMEPAGYAPLALKYSIVQKKGDSYEQVDADSEFHSGDAIRVRVEANGTAYLYIVVLGSSGQWKVMFPSEKISGGNNQVEKGKTYTIPPEGGAPFYFDETAGVERVSLILSRTPAQNMEELIYAAGDPTRNGEQHKTMMASNKGIDDAVMGRMREQMLSRDLVFEKYDGPAADGKQEKAVYAATRSKSPDARLFVDLKLVHK